MASDRAAGVEVVVIGGGTFSVNLEVEAKSVPLLLLDDPVEEPFAIAEPKFALL